MKIFKQGTLVSLMIIYLMKPLGFLVYKDSSSPFILHKILNENISNGSSEKFSNIYSPIERSLRQIHHKNTIQVEFREKGKVKMKSKIPDSLFSPQKGKKRENKQIRKLRKEKNLTMLAREIQSQASKHKLRIKRVLLGNKVRSAFKDHKLGSHLSSLLSSKSLSKRLRRLRRKLKKANQRKASKQKRHSFQNSKMNRNEFLPNNQYPQAPERSVAGMPSSTGASAGGGGGDKDKEMGFNFMPGFAGMPFPPFMMNGPHFHPPLNITVNSLPNPNPRATKPPSQIEEENLIQDQSMLDPILTKLNDIKSHLKEAGSDANVDLQEKLETLLNRFI